MSTDNKRKFPRARYQCSLTILKGNLFNTITVNTANLGAGGFLVHLDQGMMIGAKVEIKINFSETQFFECNGLVVRCHENRIDPEENTGPFSVAIAFEGLDEKKVSYLKETIEKLLISESAN